MIQTSIPITYFTDLRDNKSKESVVFIDISQFIRIPADKIYKFYVEDSVIVNDGMTEGFKVMYSSRITTKTYDEIDQLRGYLLSVNEYTSTGSQLEDDLLIDGLLLQVQMDLSYNVDPSLWIKSSSLVVEETPVEETPVEETPPE
jgi:hypothetical protein